MDAGIAGLLRSLVDWVGENLAASAVISTIPFWTIAFWFIRRRVEQRDAETRHRRDETTRAIDDLLKPLFDTVEQARWRDPPREFDSALVYAVRWGQQVSGTNDKFRYTDTHRLARYIEGELRAVSEWISAETALNSHWNQAMKQRWGPPGQALFAYLVPDTSKIAGTFGRMEAVVALANASFPTASDQLVEETVRLSHDPVAREKARACAEKHREMRHQAEQLQSAAISAMRARIANGE